MPLATFDYSSTNIPAFLSKLWTLVEDKKYDELIAWDPSGYSFHVYDQTRFSREILPRFFKHNNMASFIRQLNMYGFRKVNSIEHGSLKNEKEDMEFHHPYFIRDKGEYLELIKRKVPESKQNVVDSSLKKDDSHKILDEIKGMKSKQSSVDEGLLSVRKENEALWKEIASLRQKHHHQQQIVNKLIHFLVHLVGPSSIGLKRSRPLMIDSHSTLINMNEEIKYGLNEEPENESNEEEDFEGPPLKQKRASTSYDHDYMGTTTPSTSSTNTPKSSAAASRTSTFQFNNQGAVGGGAQINGAGTKGVVINEITDSLNLLKSTLGVEHGDEKEPVIDFVVDSPISNHNEDDGLLNSNIFLNTDVGAVNDDDSQLTVSSTRGSVVSNQAEGEQSKQQDQSSEYQNELKKASASEQKPLCSNQLLDHIQSFEINLNSIKDFLNSSSNYDNSSINNLFTPDFDYSYEEMLQNGSSDKLEPQQSAQKQGLCNAVPKNELSQFEQAQVAYPDIVFNIDDMIMQNQPDLYNEDEESYVAIPQLPQLANRKDNGQIPTFMANNYGIEENDDTYVENENIQSSKRPPHKTM